MRGHKRMHLFRAVVSRHGETTLNGRLLEPKRRPTVMDPITPPSGFAKQTRDDVERCRLVDL